MADLVTLSDVRNDRSAYDPGRKRSGRTKKLIDAEIVAIDGEGVTDLNGRHRYIMLAASDESYIAGYSLTTQQCLEYLLGLNPKGKRRLVVGFSINYDIVKWLTNLSQDNLKYLWENGRCKWGSYSIRYLPGKYITIRHADKRSIHIYDVFGFFQRSFVAALEEWKVGTPEQIERIRSMKASRSSFSEETIDDILDYCIEECQLLVDLVGKLRSALLEGGIELEHWYGAGAIAVAIMKKEQVKQYLQRQPPERLSHAILSAYYGGRFELRQSGRQYNVHSYDIRSAYPFIASTLPCQTHLQYMDRDGYIPSRWGVYYVRWNLPEDTAWCPFPFRVADTKQILYPFKGEGFYHASEVQAAMRLFPDGIDVVRSHICIQRCPETCSGKPFSFIPTYFQYRDTLKRRGSQAQLTLKLGLNSLYGKTAQGVGFGDKKPPYQSYLWAGMITAGTRAMLLDAIRENPESIISTATDGIMSKQPLNLEVGSQLGQWEYTPYRQMFVVQSGVYQLQKESGECEVRTRGFGKSETNFAAIIEAFNTDPVWGSYSYDVTRFVGLGGALARRAFRQYYGQWVPMTRELKFGQSKKLLQSEVDGVVTWESMSPPADQPTSAPYAPRASWNDLWSGEENDLFDTLVDYEQP